MSTKLPSLTGLRAFDVVGRTGSLRRAAAELGVGHSAITRQMRDLEHWFGVKLLSTTAHGTSLTADGQRLHGYVSAGFDLIVRGAMDVRPHGARRTLRIWCTPGLATHWITPRLAEIQKRLPTTDIALIPSDGTPSFQKNEADLEIRFGHRHEPGLRSEGLATPAILIVASPSWIGRNPDCRDPRALATCELVHEANTEWWRLWFERVGVKTVGKLKGPCLGTLPTAIAAACAGHGAALVTEPLIRDLLAAGVLEVVVDTAVVFEDYVAVSREDRADESVILAFKRWFRESMGAGPSRLPERLSAVAG